MTSVLRHSHREQVCAVPGGFPPQDSRRTRDESSYRLVQTVVYRNLNRPGENKSSLFGRASGGSFRVGDKRQ